MVAILHPSNQRQTPARQTWDIAITVLAGWLYTNQITPHLIMEILCGLQGW